MSVERLAAALADRYNVERELGAGGMATVYLAEDVKHGRRVAVKVLHPELAAALGADRFLAEIKTTANLQHPHILPLHDSGEADGFLFYVMPFVDGESLRDRLSRETQLPLDDALRIAREVADALGYAHSHGVIHRDVKPENILLQGGHALVADFGIALAVQQAGGHRMTQTGLSLGTPQYMSPEQAMGERSIDARSDIYALGAVTYEMLAGDPPFTGSSVQAIVAKVMTERPQPLRTVRDTVPAGVEQAVLKALAKLPADRFASTAEFMAALHAPATVESAGRGMVPMRAHSMWPAAVLTVMVIGALGVAGWSLARTRATPSSAIFDAGLPNDAPMSSGTTSGATGFGHPNGGLSIAPNGTFVVYSAPQGDSTILWYRSLVDASAHPIDGTAGGTLPRISPDGARLAFVAGDRTLVLPISGGAPRRLMDGDPPTTLMWVSATRLLAINNQGYTLNWIDPEVGVVERQALNGRDGRCFSGQWLPARRQLLCSFNESATILDLTRNEGLPIRVRAVDGSLGARASGAAFRLIGDRYMTYVALDGTLRAAAFDPETRTLGRSVAIVSGVDRDVVGGAQLDLAANDLLGFAPTTRSTASRMVALKSGAEPQPLPIDAATFLRFDMSRDRRRLAAVVLTDDGVELRIYDLRLGRSQAWLRGNDIRMPLWTPRGDRLAVYIRSDSGSALLLGSPDAAGPPDTLMRGQGPETAFDPVDFPDDTTLIARGGGTRSYRVHLATRPVRIDTLLTDAFFSTVSPDGKHLAWHTASSNQLFVGGYPPSARRQLIATAGVEPLWLSPTSLLFRSNVTWYEARIDAVSGELTGPPKIWARDPRFVDTPGWSNRLSWDGGIIYARSPLPSDTRYLRFIPDFAARVKTAVDGAGK
jgi:serine/threonine protein kinase